MSAQSCMPDREQLLALIHAQTRIARLGPDLNTAMIFMAAQAMKLTGASGAVIELAEGDDMVYRAVAGAATASLGQRLNRKHSLSGLCVTTGKAIYCPDSELDPRANQQACRQVGLRSMVVTPLLYDASCVGVLKVFSASPDAFSAQHCQLLELLSEMIAATMHHAARYGSAELLRQATTDALTGLANRARLLDELRQQLEHQQPLALLMLDMDGLKPINDCHGHRFGDAALCEIAHRINNSVSPQDLVARIGGDEFVVLLSQVDDVQQARQIASRISTRCAQPLLFEGQRLELGASIGMALYPQDGREPEQLLEHADLAMYRDKSRRKARRAPPLQMQAL